jgi:hypothetical protein
MAGDDSHIDPRHVIEVTMEDNSELDMTVLQREMEECEAARLRDKLACLQKTRSGVIKKMDTASSSSKKDNIVKVTKPGSPADQVC